MMPRWKSYIFFASAMLALGPAACGHKSDYTPVPLPYGYQRTLIYPPEYRVVDSLPASFAVNASALVRVLPRTSDAAVMADIYYPAYGATLHLTFTQVDSLTLDDVVANRRERMSLNLADNFATLTEIGPTPTTDFHTSVLLSAGRTPTPVQLLGISPQMVVSGAVRFDSEQVGADSLMPVLKAITRDIEYAAERMH